MSKHQFEIIEDDEDLEILEENTPSSYVDQNSQERIRLPSGQWILRNRITGEQRETSSLDDAEPERQEEEIENVVIPDNGTYRFCVKFPMIDANAKSETFTLEFLPSADTKLGTYIELPEIMPKEFFDLPKNER